MGSTPRSTSSTSRGAPGLPGAAPRTPGGGEPELLDVGRVVKPHGLRGELVVDLWTNRLERLEPGHVLETAAGGVLEVEEARPHQGRFLVRLAGVASREAAEALRGTVLRAPAMEDPDALWVHDLVGAEVVDTDGRCVGSVEAVEPNPASDLLVLDGGRLVPLTFALRLERGAGSARRVVIDPPAGLLD